MSRPVSLIMVSLRDSLVKPFVGQDIMTFAA